MTELVILIYLLAGTGFYIGLLQVLKTIQPKLYKTLSDKTFLTFIFTVIAWPLWIILGVIGTAKMIEKNDN